MAETTRKWAPMDAETRFCEDKTMTADGAVQEASADVIIPIGPGYKEGDLVINITALDATTGDEAVAFILEGTNNATFGTAAQNIPLARLDVGVHAGVDLPIGRYIVPFTNERGGTTYTNLRLVLDVAGTTPSVTFDAWIAPAC